MKIKEKNVKNKKRLTPFEKLFWSKNSCVLFDRLISNCICISQIGRKVLAAPTWGTAPLSTVWICTDRSRDGNWSSTYTLFICTTNFSKRHWNIANCDTDLFVPSNNRGKVIKPLQYQSTVAPGTVARVEPNIKWFGEYTSCAFYMSSIPLKKWINLILLGFVTLLPPSFNCWHIKTWKSFEELCVEG